MQLLEQLIFVPAAMSPLNAWPREGFSGNSARSSDGISRAEAGSKALFASPWVIADSVPKLSATLWQSLCSACRQAGVLVECSTASLEQVPVTAVPRRLFQQRIDCALDLENMHSADVVELVCCNSQGVWGWPPELGSADNFDNWFQAVRCVLDGQTPIGLGLVAGVDNRAIGTALESGANFLALHQADSLELLVETLSRVRTLMANQILPVLVRAKLSHPMDLIRILALGADAVTIDDFLKDLWNSSTSVSSTFLGTRIPVAPQNDCPVTPRLQLLQQRLRDIYQSCRADSLKEIRGSLRATTQAAAQLAGIPCLNSSSKL